MKTILTGLLLLSISLSSFSQLKQGVRREFDVYNASKDIVLTGSNGFMMIYRDTVIKGEETWKIRKFDTNLKDQETIEFKSEKSLNFSLEHFSEEQFTYYKLDYKYYGKAKPFKIFVFDASGSRVVSKEGTFPENFAPTSIKSVGHSVFISGSIKKNQAMVCMNVQTGKCTLLSLPGLDQKMNIQQVEPYEAEKIVAVTVIYGKKPETRVLQVCLFKEDGSVLRKPVDIDNNEGKFPVSASVTFLEEGNFMIAGAYSSDKDWMANGIYLASFTGAKQRFVKYYSFSDLKNFNEYLSQKRKEKVEKKIEKSKSKGGEDIIDTYIKTHKIIKYNDQYILVGEVYYPTYRSESYTTYTNGQTVTHYRTVFDGYQYTHATVISVDENGNKKWDNCFSMWASYKPFRVVEMVKAISASDNVKLMFSSGTEIKAEQIEENGISESVLGKLETNDDNDKVKATSSTTEYWYDNYFMTYGWQKIKNSDNDKKKRQVYFVNKIEFN